MIEVVNVGDFGREAGYEVSTLPGNIVLLGWSSEERSWFCGPERNFGTQYFDRVQTTVNFFENSLLSRLAGGSFWFLLCFWDGWRERHVFSHRYTWVPAGNLDTSAEWSGLPGELPIFHPTRRWIACYCAHRGDPSAVVLPDPHYLKQAGYRTKFAGLRRHQRPWETKKSRAVFCGGDHGDVANYFPPPVPGRPHPRRYLKMIVENAKLDVDVHLGQGVSLAHQCSYKWILDIDGFARTWDAFAWKMQSGSVTLSVTSPWETFFTRYFQPWVHYVPIANDFSDLAEILGWCRAHDDECREIAQQARRHAESIYRPEHAARVVARQWRTLLSDPQSAGSIEVTTQHAVK
jgi:hypothetical protein